MLVGINLLREGLDLPEVSLVAILDADKEGFLRNRRSLIQTMGRAARNAQGEVIMYADTITDSMREAIGETSRRRALQEAFNEEHGIVPRTVKKSITDVSAFISEAEENVGKRQRKDGAFYTASGEGAAEQGAPAEVGAARAFADEVSELPAEEVERVIDALEEEMAAASESMDFEAAARIRDQLVEIRSRFEGTSADEVIARLKAGARKGSAHATRRRYRPRKR